MSLPPFPVNLTVSTEPALEVARIGIFDAQTTVARRTIKVVIEGLQIFVSEPEDTVGSDLDLLKEAASSLHRVIAALSRGGLADSSSLEISN